jgi:hypothetical protein
LRTFGELGGRLRDKKYRDKREKSTVTKGTKMKVGHLSAKL